MEYHAWLVFVPSDNNRHESDETVKAIARHWMNTLPGERDTRTETVYTRPDGMKLYRIIGDTVAWRAWQAREGPNVLCSDRKDWPTFPDEWQPPQLKRMRGED